MQIPPSTASSIAPVGQNGSPKADDTIFTKQKASDSGGTVDSTPISPSYSSLRIAEAPWKEIISGNKKSSKEGDPQ